MQDRITSLCYVNSRNDRTTELCRIADYVDGSFMAYRYDSSRDFYEYERDLIYGSNADLPVEVGKIVVCAWYPYLSDQKKWLTDTVMSDTSWCEVIITKCNTLDELVELLKAGFSIPDGYDGLHDLILCCSTASPCDGVYIEKSDASYRDGKLTIKDNVISLTRVKLDRRYATGDCKCRSSRNDRRMYLAKESGCRRVGKIDYKSRREVIGEVVRQNIGKCELGRRERQVARAALDKLSVPSVVEMIASRYDCSSDQASEYVQDYLSNVREKLDSDTSMKLIELLIENDSDAAQRMREEIQKQWDELQQERMEEEERRQAEVDAYLDSVHAQIEDAEKSLHDIFTKREEAESKVEDAILLREQIESEISKRLESFKKDYASTLVENAVYASAGQNSEQSVPVNQTHTANNGSWKVSLPENIPEEGSLEDNMDAAVECWKDICHDHQMTYGLTLLSFAAYAMKQSMLIVGESAIAVSDLISASVCGQPAIRIYPTDELPDYEGLIEKIKNCPDAVICLINGLKLGYDHLRVLMQMCPERMFVITEMHAESLVMEPASLFTVFLPLFCDYFYAGGHVSELPVYDCCEILYTRLVQLPAKKVKEARVQLSRWFDQGFYPPATRERCALLFALMSLLSQSLGVNADKVQALSVEFILAPLMSCMRKFDSLRSHLEECTNLDQDRKEILLHLYGSEG